MKSTLILLVTIATLALAKFETWPSGLQVEYISVPETCDKKPLNGQMVLVHYTVTHYALRPDELKDGKKYESDRREIFQVGTKGMDPRRAIKGMEEAVLDMCIGEKRRLIVPPQLSYREFDNTLEGMDGYSGIDCLDKKTTITLYSTTLYYDIELISAKDQQADDPNVFKTIDTNGDSNLSKEEISIYLEETCYPGKKELHDWIWNGFLELLFSKKDEDENDYISHEEFSGSKKFETRPSGLKVKYISVPENCDVKAVSEQVVLVHYTGKLKDGTKFQSDRREFFQVGEGTDPRRAVKGVEEGVLGMCIGEKRKLIVPPELGRGQSGDYTLNEMSGCSVISSDIWNAWNGIDCLDNDSIIPSGSTLYYDIELIDIQKLRYVIGHDAQKRILDIKRGEAEFKIIDINGDSILSKKEMSIFMKEAYQSSNEDKRLDEIFGFADNDKNGYISHEEWSGFLHEDTVFGVRKDEL